MFYFEGQYRSERRQILDRTQKLLSRQNVAAVKLQALVRGVLTRYSLKVRFGTAFDQLANEFLPPSSVYKTSDSVTTTENADPLLSRLLSLLMWLCRKKPDEDRVLTICKILQSKTGRAVLCSWIVADSPKTRYPLGYILWSILRYLANLPAQSTSYATPIRTLETILISPQTTFPTIGSHGARFQMWLYLFLGRKQYFRSLVKFMHNQLPPTAGYLTTDVDSGPQKRWEFDSVEFEKTPRCRGFLDLILAPLTWAQKIVVDGKQLLPNYSPKPMEDLLICALNDLMIPHDDNYSCPERIIRGVGPHLFDTPSSLEIAPQLFLSCASSIVDRDQAFRLVPSLNLLHLLSTVVVPRLIAVNSSPLACLTPSDSNATPSSSPELASNLVRSLAGFVTKALTSAELPTIRPLKNPKPLAPISLDEEDEEEDVEKEKDNDQLTISEQSAWIPCWPTELLEIFVPLHQMLPCLASASLISHNQLTANLVDPVYPQELVESLAILHYALSQSSGLHASQMIGLNSIYSRHPAYLRSLWYWITTISVSQSGASTNLNKIDAVCPLLSLLSTGELPQDISLLHRYLPMIFTFADCLHHRLLCLTDTEICGLDSNGFIDSCGFQTEQLLHVGIRLRDLMLGLIELSHPDQFLGCVSNFGIPFGTSAPPALTPCFHAYPKRPEPVTIEKVFEWMKRENERLGDSELNATMDINDSRQNSESSNNLRIWLHCWLNLFRLVQRLVFQIYDWHRRCNRQSLLQSAGHILPASSKLPGRLSNTTQAFWFKPNLADSIDSSLRSRLKRDEDLIMFTLAGVPFGYYSLMNPDREQDHHPLSNREVRQILILKEMPFVIPFERRVKLFQLLIESSRASVQGNSLLILDPRMGFVDPDSFSHVSLYIRRNHLYEDAFEKMSKDNEPTLKPRMRVRFRNAFGLEEGGVDAGGLSREFLSELIRTGFDPTRGLFVYTSEKTLYPNPESAALADNHLDHYFFLGRILAKVLYESLLVDVQFAHFFLAKITSRTGGGVGFDYLQSLDPELYKQLGYLKTCTGNVRDLSLDFTTVRSTFGQSDTVELKPDGRHIPVTESNRIEYMHLVADYKLNKQIRPQVQAFIAGLNDVIYIDWLRMFDADELQVLISGADTTIDIEDLKQHTIFHDSSPEHQETYDHFWSVLRSFTESEKRSFLRFVTACPRPPMFGFRDLQPPFEIHINDDLDRLPTASTCANVLRLPNLRDYTLLRERLLYALNAEAGFEYG